MWMYWNLQCAAETVDADGARVNSLKALSGQSSDDTPFNSTWGRYGRTSVMKHIELLKRFRVLIPESLSRTLQGDNAQGELIQLRIKPIQVQRHLSLSRMESHMWKKDGWIINSRSYVHTVPIWFPTAQPGRAGQCHRHENPKGFHNLI